MNDFDFLSHFSVEEKSGSLSGIKRYCFTEFNLPKKSEKVKNHEKKSIFGVDEEKKFIKKLKSLFGQ